MKICGPISPQQIISSAIFITHFYVIARKTLTEEGKKEYIKELKKIAQKTYGRDYRELCPDEQKVVKTKYKFYKNG